MKFPGDITDGMENAQLEKLWRFLQTDSEFKRYPEQNTWAVIAVLAVIVTALIILRIAYGGS